VYRTISSALRGREPLFPCVPKKRWKGSLRARCGLQSRVNPQHCHQLGGGGGGKRGGEKRGVNKTSMLARLVIEPPLCKWDSPIASVKKRGKKEFHREARPGCSGGPREERKKERGRATAPCAKARKRGIRWA